MLHTRQVRTYVYTRFPYERCISRCEWFHKACQDNSNSVFKGETNFVCSKCVQMFHTEQFIHAETMAHVKSTFKPQTAIQLNQYHLSLCLYHLVGRFIWPSSTFCHKEPSMCIHVGTYRCVCNSNVLYCAHN